MRKEEKASISIMKIICVAIILILASGIGVMAVNNDLKDIKITLQNGYEMSVLTGKSTVEEVLEENNIVLEDNQKTTPDLKDEIQAGENIKITDKSYNEVQISKISEEGVSTSLDQLLENYSPITEKIVVEQEEIPYETITKNTTGTESDVDNKVLQEGKNGTKEITYKIKYQNDKEIEKTVLSEKVTQEPVNKIVQVTKKVTNRSATTERTATTATSEKAIEKRSARVGGKWSYSSSEFDLLCAITAQECGSSYDGALAVITTACNRAESSKWASKGSDPLSQYKAQGQFCYTIDNNWRNKLGGNYSSSVRQAVTDALNGKRNHNYLSFRAANTGKAGQKIGGNVYF